MAWPLIAAAALGAVSGARKARIEKKKAKEHDRFRREAIRMSPWSGMGDPGAYQGGNTDMFSGMLSGGASGAIMGQGLTNMGAFGGAAGGAGGAAGASNIGTQSLVGSGAEIDDTLNRQLQEQSSTGMGMQQTGPQGIQIDSGTYNPNQNMLKTWGRMQDPNKQFENQMLARRGYDPRLIGA